MSRTAHKTCNLCEAGCGLLIDVEGVGDARVTRIRADEEDPISRGHICPKAIALREIQEDPDRLRRPVRRTRSGGWEEVSWEAALDEVAAKLAGIQLRDGNDAVGMYLGNPGAHNFGTVAYIAALRRALATRNQYTASSCDQNPKHAASLYLFGNVFKIAVPDLDRTDFLLMLGANPVVSNGSLMTAPGIRHRLRALKERGGELVVIDPRKTATAALADRHFFIRPGTDALLMASLVHVVRAEGLGRETHLADRVTGEVELERLVNPFPPEAVADRVGIPAAEIRFLARSFAAAPTAACYGRVGTSLQPFATLTNWLVDVLNLVTGNLDRPGGVLHANPAVDLADLVERIPGGPKEDWRTRVRGAPSFNGEQPAACLAEEIRTPGEGRIRGLLTLAGNPVLSTPNGRGLDAAFEELEYYAAIDIYRNETTRHAQLILPPTWSLEHGNYEIVFHQFAVHNSAKWSPAVLARPAGALSEWEILLELALRIGEAKADGALARRAFRTLRRRRDLFRPERVLDWMLRIGPRGDRFLPWRSGLRFADLEAAPRGIDLGPLEPSLEAWLDTRDARIDLAHPKMCAELVRLAGTLEAETLPGREGEEPELLLIGRRDSRTNNSWLHNVPMAVKGRDRCTLLMHPDDARKRGLASDDRVRVRSRVGEVEVPLELSEDLMRGVVCLPHGWGHDRPGLGLSLASRHAGVSFNDVADEHVIEPVVGNAVLNGVPVEVLRAR